MNIITHPLSSRDLRIKPKQPGFTIVELLIVIVIIGILAAITIVAYNGIQNRAIEASVRSDMANAGKKLELLKAELTTYPAQTDAGLEAAGIQLNKTNYDITSTTTNFLYCGSTTSTNYAFVALAKSGKTYAYGNARTFSEYTAYPISNYTSICSDLIGSGAARYAYSSGWRAWAG
ncbi:Type II secretion system protein G precursor [compost metagenome]